MILSICLNMTRNLSTSFQTENPEIIESYDKVNAELKDISNNRKTSVSQTCYFALILAREYIEKLENEIKENKSEMEKLDKQNLEIENKLNRLADF